MTFSVRHAWITAPTALMLLASQSLWATTDVPQLKNESFRVKLTSDLSTKTSKANDEVTAQVLSPAKYKNWIMEGKVTHVSERGSGRFHLRKETQLSFDFETLTNAKGNIAIPVSAVITKYVNSKGKENVDEEGEIIASRSDAVQGAAVGAVAGGLIGRMSHSVKATLIGAAAGAAVGATVATVSVHGPEMSFNADSQFDLSVSTRERPPMPAQTTTTAESQPAKSGSEPAPAGDVTKLTLVSTPKGADIEVDGNFVGNTPSTIDVSAGEHTVTVSKTGYKTWERKLKASGGNVNLNVELLAQAK